MLQICHEALVEQQLASAQPKMAAAAAARAAAAAAAGAGVGSDRDGLLQVSAGGLQCSCSAGAAWAGGRAGIGVTGDSGLSYFECRVLTDGLCRVGWSSMNARLELGKDAHGFGFGGTGKKSNNNKFEEYGEAYGKGDVIGCLLDRKGHTISYYKNGEPLGDAFDLPSSLNKHALFPAICLKIAHNRQPRQQQ